MRNGNDGLFATNQTLPPYSKLELHGFSDPVNTMVLATRMIILLVVNLDLRIMDTFILDIVELLLGLKSESRLLHKNSEGTLQKQIFDVQLKAFEGKLMGKIL